VTRHAAAAAAALSEPPGALARQLAVLSLCSGIGGLDLGLERAGMRVVGQVEIDPWCRAVLAEHWPGVPRHDDARTCVAWWRSQTRPRVHVVAAGFPCQPVSLAGPQRGTDDPRWLWPAVADVLRDLRPDYALVENVPGLLVRGLGDVLGELAEIGYDAEWDCVPASALGAPHIRDRVFIVAYPHREPGGPVVGGVTGGRRPPMEPGATQPRRRSGDVADTPSDRRHPRRPGDAAQEPRGGQPHRSRVGGDVAHTDRAGRRARGGLGRTWPTPVRADWWATEPRLGRGTDGLPDRMDRPRAPWELGLERIERAAPQRIPRLTGLGNAVVPQVAEHVGRLIVADYTTSESE
jgi:DNA (cytosine-5)-methyltransferase 1